MILRYIVVVSNDPTDPFSGRRFDWGIFSKISIGTGVVGRTSHVTIIFLIAVAVAVWSVDDPWLKIGLICIGALVVAGFLGAAFAFAFKHPDYATLDGANLVRYREIESSAKDKSIIIDAQPNAPPPSEIPEWTNSDG